MKICSHYEIHRSDLASIVKRYFHDVNQYVARCFLRLWADVGGCYLQVMDEFVAVEELHALGYKDMSNLLVEEDSPILKLNSAKGVLLTVSFVLHALFLRSSTYVPFQYLVDLILHWRNCLPSCLSVALG